MSASPNKSILVIDNYDSFTYNLVHLINETGHEAIVWRNNAFNLNDIQPFDHILLSPGPGLPAEAGLLLDVIKTYSSTKSILGVCLGMQAIAEVFGGRLYNLPRPMHGKATNLRVVDPQETLFKDCPRKFKVGRYHSWALDKVNISSELKVIATDENDVIMAISHTSLNVKGVQFHPESVLTEYGKQIIDNWLRGE